MNRISESRNDHKVEVVLLSGFLGSGKTTLLKQILSWETDLSGTVVVVNEFGKVGIDGALLRDSGSDVVELPSGCICCTLSSDLIVSMRNILARFRPKRIFIEGSGVADPTGIEACLKDRDLRDHLALKKIVTVLDADYWDARDAFGPLFYKQLDVADLILLNKIDALSSEKVRQYLIEIHDFFARSRVVPTLYCRVDPETLWMEEKPKTFGLKPIQFFRPAPAECASHVEDHHTAHGESAPAGVADVVDASAYVTFSFENPRPLDEAGFLGFLRALPFEVFRMKGPVRFADRTELVNFVGGKFDWAPWQGPPETRLAFIGWNVSGEETLRKLGACITK